MNTENLLQRLMANAHDIDGNNPPVAQLFRFEGTPLLLHRLDPEEPDTVHYSTVDDPSNDSNHTMRLGQLLGMARVIEELNVASPMALLTAIALETGQLALQPTAKELRAAEHRLQKLRSPAPEAPPVNGNADDIWELEHPIREYAMLLNEEMRQIIEDALTARGHEPTMLEDMVVFVDHGNYRSAVMGIESTVLGRAANAFLERTGAQPLLDLDLAPDQHAAMHALLTLLSRQFNFTGERSKPTCTSTRFSERRYTWEQVLARYPDLKTVPVTGEPVAEPA